MPKRRQELPKEHIKTDFEEIIEDDIDDENIDLSDGDVSNENSISPNPPNPQTSVASPSAYTNTNPTIITPPTADEELENFLKSYPDIETSKITIYRWKDTLNDWALVGSYNLKDFETTTDKIARKYGGGTYKFMIRNSRGQYVKQFTMNFDETAYPVKTESNNVIVQNSVPDFSNFIKEYKSELKENQNLILQLIQQNQQMMLQAFTTLAQNNKQHKEVDSMDMFMKALNITKELNKNPVDNIDKMLEVFKTGIEVASSLQPEGESGSVVEKLLTGLLGNPSSKLSGMIEKLLDKPNQPLIQNPQPVKQLPNNTNNTNKNEAKMDIGGQMKNIIEVMAQKNINPDKIAKTFLDSADDFTLNLIINLKDEKEQIKALLLEYFPFLEKYPQWTETLINSIIKISSEYVEEESIKENTETSNENK